MSNTLVVQPAALLDVQTVEEEIKNLVSSIEYASTTDDTTWLTAIGKGVIGLNVIQNTSLLAECAILFTVKRLWDAEEIDPELLSSYDDFWAWATEATQKGVEVASRTTIENKMRVYEIYFHLQDQEGGYAKPAEVFFGEDGARSIENPSLYDVAFSKLLAAAPSAKKGFLHYNTDFMLYDPKVKAREFQNQLKLEKLMQSGVTLADLEEKSFDKAPKKGQEQKEKELEETPSSVEDDEVDGPEFFTGEDPELEKESGVFGDGRALYVTRDGTTAAMLEIRNPENPMVIDKLTKLLPRLGLSIMDFDLDADANAKIEGPYVSADPDGNILFNLDGNALIMKSKEHATAILTQLRDALEA